MASRWYWEGSTFVVVVDGVFTDEDVTEPNRECYADERFMDMRSQIADYRGVEDFAVSADAVRNAGILDAEASERNPDVKVAIVLSGKLAYGLARMYENAGAGSAWETGIFETMEEAKSWLAEPADPPS